MFLFMIHCHSLGHNTIHRHICGLTCVLYLAAPCCEYPIAQVKPGWDAYHCCNYSMDQWLAACIADTLEHRPLVQAACHISCSLLAIPFQAVKLATYTQEWL